MRTSIIKLSGNTILNKANSSISAISKQLFALQFSGELLTFKLLLGPMEGLIQMPAVGFGGGGPPYLMTGLLSSLISISWIFFLTSNLKILKKFDCDMQSSQDGSTIAVVFSTLVAWARGAAFHCSSGNIFDGSGQGVSTLKLEG